MNKKLEKNGERAFLETFWMFIALLSQIKTL